MLAPVSRTPIRSVLPLKECTILCRICKKEPKAPNGLPYHLLVCDDSAAISVTLPDKDYFADTKEEQCVRITGLPGWQKHFNSIFIRASKVEQVKEDEGMPSTFSSTSPNISQTVRAFGIVPFVKDAGKDGKPGTYRVLLVQLHEGHWGFPKGHLDDAETADACASREFEEESGVPSSLLTFVNQEALPGKTIYEEVYEVTKDGKTFNKISGYYAAQVNKDSVEEVPVAVQASEIKAYKWATFEEAMDLITYKNCKDVMQAAHIDIVKYIGQ